MQDLNKPQMTQPQKQERSNQTTQSVYMRPQIEMYKEEDLLKRLIVWGSCSPRRSGIIGKYAL